MGHMLLGLAAVLSSAVVGQPVPTEVCRRIGFGGMGVERVLDGCSSFDRDFPRSDWRRGRGGRGTFCVHEFSLAAKRLCDGLLIKQNSFMKSLIFFLVLLHTSFFSTN